MCPESFTNKFLIPIPRTLYDGHKININILKYSTFLLYKYNYYYKLSKLSVFVNNKLNYGSITL